jgi:hypothetical protein
MRIQDLTNTKLLPRPDELGEAYFYIDSQLVDVGSFRNHRDWLVAHSGQLRLPDYVKEKPAKALWEGYRKGVIRLVWDKGGKWKTGQGHKQGNVLYVNGFDRDVWKNIQKIMNEPCWQGHIDTVVIEYVREVNGKPNWYHTDIFKGGALESLYKGRRPRRERLPPDAIYGGHEGYYESVAKNRLVNHWNDTLETPVMEMFNQHFVSTEFFDMLKHVPHNKWVLQSHNYAVYT